VINTSEEGALSRLFVVGINYRQSTAAERSLFSANKMAQENILLATKQAGLRSAFLLSTCNRTELFAYTADERILIELLIRNTKGTIGLFNKSGFVKHGIEALNHLFNLASGLESQIVGDNEVLGQLKSAINFSREYGMIGPIMDRTVNFALQASKAVRTRTKISNGSVSVAYAAIEWMRTIPLIQQKKILLFGTGKFGTSLAKNCKQYFPSSAITIINRTDSTASVLADALSLPWQPFSLLKQEIEKADIVILCTNAIEYTVFPGYFPDTKQRWILDLSVPENVDPAVRELPAVTVTGIDEVSLYLQNTLAMRTGEIPKAHAIIQEYQYEFYNWLKWQRHVPIINDMKTKLYALGEIHLCAIKNKEPEYVSDLLHHKVNKTVGSLARNLRMKQERGCHYINAINEFLEQDTGNE